MMSGHTRFRTRSPYSGRGLMLALFVFVLLGVAVALAPGIVSGQRPSAAAVTRSGPSTAGPSLSVAAPQSPAAAQAVISWEHDQIEPEVAYGSGPNQYLVVWEDHHWASGDARDILGRRINTSGGQQIVDDLAPD